MLRVASAIGSATCEKPVSGGGWSVTMAPPRVYGEPDEPRARCPPLHRVELVDRFDGRWIRRVLAGPHDRLVTGARDAHGQCRPRLPRRPGAAQPGAAAARGRDVVSAALVPRGRGTGPHRRRR